MKAPKFKFHQSDIYLKKKSVKEARVGDTFFHKDKPVELFEGFKIHQPKVFAGIFLVENTQEEVNKFEDAIGKLTRNFLLFSSFLFHLKKQQSE